MNAPTFSVVVPLYNKALYVRRAVQSVLNQTVADFELIVVDDGSTDGGAKMAEAIGDSRIRLVKQLNAGASAARNRGISEARADLIAFLDADDEWKADFLLHVRRLRHDFPECGAYATAYVALGPKGEIKRPSPPDVPPPPWVGIIPRYFRSLLTSAPFCSSSICIRREVFDTFGAFPVGVRRGEDILMWIKLALHYPIGYSPARQAIYHLDAESRACNSYPDPADPAIYLREVISTGLPSHDQLADVIAYHDHLMISKAFKLAKIGRRRSAIELLDGCMRAHPLNPRALAARLLACLPVACSGRILALRARIKPEEKRSV